MVASPHVNISGTVSKTKDAEVLAGAALLVDVELTAVEETGEAMIGRSVQGPGIERNDWGLDNKRSDAYQQAIMHQHRPGLGV